VSYVFGTRTKLHQSALTVPVNELEIWWWKSGESTHWLKDHSDLSSRCVPSINYSLSKSHECLTEQSTSQAVYAGSTSVYNSLHCWTLSDHTWRTTSRSQDQLPPLPMDDKPEMDRELPVVLRQRHRWVSRVTEQKIEEAWGPTGPHQICQVCQEERPSHRALRLHVDAHFLLHFCPCGFHDVYPYPVIVHKMDCFAGEGHMVDEDCFSQYLDAIRTVIKKAINIAALSSGFQTLLTDARRRSLMTQDPPATPAATDDTPANDGTATTPMKEKTPPPPGPSWLATVEERLTWLQTEFTQLAPDLLSTATGLYQLKDSVGQLKRRLRARQARHRSQSLQE